MTVPNPFGGPWHATSVLVTTGKDGFGTVTLHESKANFQELIKAIHGYGSEIRPNQPRCWFFLVILVHSLNPTKLCKVCCSLGLFPSECEPSVHILVVEFQCGTYVVKKKTANFDFCANNPPIGQMSAQKIILSWLGKTLHVLINSKSWSELFVWKRNTTSLLIRIMYSTHEPSYFRTIFVNQIFCG